MSFWDYFNHPLYGSERRQYALLGGVCLIVLVVVGFIALGGGTFSKAPSHEKHNEKPSSASVAKPTATPEPEVQPTPKPIGDLRVVKADEPRFVSEEQTRTLEAAQRVQEGRGGDALSLAEIEANARGNDADAWSHAGSLALAVGNREKAAKYFVKALEYQPKQPQALLNLGNIYFEDFKYSDAARLLEVYMDEEPENQYAAFRWAVSLMMIDKNPKATLVYLPENSGAGLYARVGIAWKSGQHDLARQLLATARFLRPPQAGQFEADLFVMGFRP